MSLANVPENFIIGDAIDFEIDLSDFSAALYLMQFALVQATTQKIWAASADGDTFVISELTAAGYVEGRYSYHIYLTEISTSKRQTIAEGTMSALPDLLGATTGHDNRSALEIELDDVNAAITAVTQMKSYTIQQRTFTRENLSELRKLRSDIYKRMSRQKTGGKMTRSANMSGRSLDDC